EPIMHYLTQLNNYFGATIHLVWINTPYDFRDDSETRPWLNGIARDYKLDNYTINIYNHHDKDYGVVYFADDLRADLIVLAISEKTVVQRIITGGSLAEDVSDHTIRPVMTLKLK
ncbi:MAG: universal stress protein, partial [Cyclobacteriaceae bacterium]